MVDMPIYDRRNLVADWSNREELERQRDRRRWDSVQSLSKHGVRYVDNVVRGVNSEDKAEFYTAVGDLCRFVGSLCGEMGDDRTARIVHKAADEIYLSQHMWRE